MSAWEKPEELKSEQEKVAAAVMAGISQSKWKEYTSATGKKYYFNTETRVTQWSLPNEMKAAAATAEAAAAAKAAAALPAAAAPVAAAASGGEGADGAATGEALRQFMAMLDECDVAVDSSWEECMKRIINRPVYKVIPTLAERKAAFTQWQEEAREKVEEEERRRVRQIKVRSWQRSRAAPGHPLQPPHRSWPPLAAPKT